MRAVVIALTVTTGCSFALTSNPPPPCTLSSVAPIVDTAVATLAAIGAAYFFLEDEPLAGGVSSGLALGAAAGAYVGHGRVGRCRAVTP